MRIHNLCADDGGESHFRDIDVEWTDVDGAHKHSGRLPNGGIIFRETTGVSEADLAWHPAPRRQYIINFNAGVLITASDGETREIGAGEVLLVEDTSGKGHQSRAVGGVSVRHSIIVPLD